MLYGENLGKYLSLDETSVSNGELYTVLTNKEANEKKDSVVVIVKGTKTKDVIDVLKKIPVEIRNMVKEVTVDMAASMNLLAKESFPKTDIVTDRFDGQKLVSEAVQEQRIRLRWEIIEVENKSIEEAQKKEEIYKPELHTNGDTHR